ncbi:MAG: AAA family ATPase, partial [Planctomycetota bacterium]|nr:AAA family ATPase [Planctomycetota bacterium]
LPRILYQSDDSSQQPMFASFVATQASLLQHPRVQAKAMSSAAWKALGRPVDAAAEARFAKQLVVRANMDTPELINVSFSDTEAKAAMVAVREVIQAYIDLFVGDDEKRVREMRTQELTTRKQKLEAEKRGAENSLVAASQEFATDDLGRLVDHYFTQLLAFDTRLAEMVMKLTELGIDPAKLTDDRANTPDETLDQPSTAAPAPATPPSPDRIARDDPTMAKLILDRGVVRRQLDSLRQSYAEGHREVVRVRKELETIEQNITKRVAEWVSMGVEPDAQLTTSDEGMTPKQLSASYVRLKQETEKLRAQTQAVSSARLKYDDIAREIKGKQALLDEVNNRIDQIEVESKAQEVGRITKMLPDDPPSSPNDDPRLKYSAMGLVLGGGMPVAFMLLLGLVDRRLRYADQTADTGRGVRLLGVLPELPGISADPEQVAAAVHTVHHIRTKLRLSGPTRKVYAITSPLSGDGKTSLSLSLAISHTAAGARTLLIDFDLVGHALTSRLNASCERGVGHDLVFAQGEHRIVATSVPGLELMPAGANDIRYQSRVTPELFEGLIRHMRDRYDTIIGDTGPILGSLEANIAASVADGVILVVGRGVQTGRIREATDHLVQLGARLVGMVFNRAYAADFNHSSVASVSLRSLRTTAPPRPVPSVPIPGMETLDTLCRTMAIDRHNNESAS